MRAANLHPNTVCPSVPSSLLLTRTSRNGKVLSCSASTLVNFDVESLSTKVPIEDTIQLLSINFNKQSVEIFRHVLTTTYFLYDGSFCDQKHGVAMGSPGSSHSQLIHGAFWKKGRKYSNSDASQIL
jgi:hypothetical protein